MVVAFCSLIKQTQVPSPKSASQAHGQTSPTTPNTATASHNVGRAKQWKWEPGADMPTLGENGKLPLCVPTNGSQMQMATQENGRAKQPETRARVALASVTECSNIQLPSSRKHCRQKLGIFKFLPPHRQQKVNRQNRGFTQE